MKKSRRIVILFVAPRRIRESITKLRKQFEGSPVERTNGDGATRRKSFGVSSAELAGFYMRRWWSVEQPVLDYIECRSKILLPELPQVVEMIVTFLP